MKKTPKPILCDICHGLTMHPVWFKRQWVCDKCLNDADYGDREFEMSNHIYQSGALSWVT